MYNDKVLARPHFNKTGSFLFARFNGSIAEKYLKHLRKGVKKFFMYRKFMLILINFKPSKITVYEMVAHILAVMMFYL